MAVLASVATSRTASFGAGAETNPITVTEGFQTALLVGAAVAVWGAVLAAVLISSDEAKEHSEAARAGHAPAVA